MLVFSPSMIFVLIVVVVSFVAVDDSPSVVCLVVLVVSENGDEYF